MKVIPPIACVTTREVITSVVGDRVINPAREVGRPLGAALGENVTTVITVVGDALRKTLGDRLGDVLDNALGELENIGSVTEESPAKDTAAIARPRPTITDDAPKDIDT